jgi:hypothetical protein
MKDLGSGQHCQHLANLPTPYFEKHALAWGWEKQGL